MDGSSLEESVVESTKTPEQSVQQGGGSVVQVLTPEELVAKAIAPVKKEFLLPPRARPSTNETTGVDSETKPAAPSNLLKEKKSKRQLKRERLQEKNSVANLCPEVARTGDANSCKYGDRCRFSHNIEAFKSQKADNLEGDCPFLTTDGPCPYGLGCRFSATHKEGFPTEASNGRKVTSEINGLSKDVQRLLWKNKMTFPKADAQLKLLGLRGPNNMKNEKLSEESGITSDQPPVTVENGCCEKEEGSDGKLDHPPQLMEDKDCTNVTSVEADVRPLKKVKSSVDENHNSDDQQNGTSLLEKDVMKTDTQSESATTASDTDSSLKVHPREKKLIDFSEKLYLAPLTTVGNLPFRRVCKALGADVTCGEMAMCTNLLQGQASEWALLRRHTSEDLFGVQICGAYPDTVTRAVELINRECTVDFIDINMGCPIDIVVNKGAGSALLTKPMRMKNIILASSAIADIPITVKVRTGYLEGRNRIDSLIEDISQWGASALTIHGRSRQQRYSKLADWEYIYQCARKAPEALQVLGNGDVYSYLDWNKHKSDCPELSSCMIARGALIKPWLFTEIKEQRHWDISSGERLNILKDYVRFGLQHWGSDAKGVETTRHFLLEWLSYTYRYIPVGLLDVIPARLNWRAPSFFGRDDLETLMASDSAADWVRISELLLGKVPAGFSFAPKHKSNAYDKAENG